MIKIYRHYGLDGAACEMLLRLREAPLGTNNTIVTFVSHPRTIDTDIEKHLTTAHDSLIDELWIVDICPSKAVCEKLNKVYKDKKYSITLVNHHKNNTWLKCYPWVAFNSERCAAQLVLHESGLVDANLKSFVDAVAARDLRLVEAPARKRGEDLHSLYKFLGSELFISIFLRNINADNSLCCATFLSNSLTDILRRNSEQYVKNVIDNQLMTSAYFMDTQGQSFKVLFAVEQHEQIGQAALAHPESADLKFVVVVNPVTNKCSLYSHQNEDTTNVSLLVEKLGGHGNNHAATFFTNVRQRVIKDIAALFTK